MDQENIMLFRNQDESYTMIDLYLYDRFFGCKDSYNYYDIYADEKLLYKKSDGKYFIRYNTNIIIQCLYIIQTLHHYN